MMSIPNGLMALGVLAALSFSACSGGGGGATSSGLPQRPPSSSSGATSQMATRTYTLASAAGSYDLPPLGGFSGSLALPAMTVPADTRLALTSSLQAPAGAPILQGKELRPQATGTLNVYFYETIRLTSTVTFPTLSGFSVTLPATVNPAGLQFFYAISNPKPTNGAKVQFRTEGPATVSGQIVTFVPSTTPLALQAGQPYTIAFYAISAIAAKPTPTPPAAGKIYITTYENNTLATYGLDGAQETPMITFGLDSPQGLAVDASGKIYVTNWIANTVTTYTAAGVPTTPTITAGISEPDGVAVDANGKIYVTNVGNNTLTTYASDGTSTTPTITGLSWPVGVAVDASGKIYVANCTANTVMTYTSAGVPTTPTITVGLAGPAGLAVQTATGNIYVANAGGAACGMQGSSGGNTVTTYTSNGEQTTPTIAAGLDVPLFIAVNGGKIYVVNRLGNDMTTYLTDGTQTTPTITGLTAGATGLAIH
jgi:hypothetical protein